MTVEQLTSPHYHGVVVIVSILKLAATVPEGFMFFSQQITMVSRFLEMHDLFFFLRYCRLLIWALHGQQVCSRASNSQRKGAADHSVC